MAAVSTLARPYARAVFDLARAGGTLAQWTDVLGSAAALAGHPLTKAQLASPRLSRESARALLAAPRPLPEPTARHYDGLIEALLHHRRATLLPEIAIEYARLRDEHERRARVRVRSALPIASEQQQRLAAALGRKLAREVHLEVELDPSVLAGVVIEADGSTIDGSLRGRLQALAQALTH